jgi:hypothetical protein
LVCNLTSIINVAYRELKGTEITMSILKDLINFTAGVMGILFEKYEGAEGQAQEEVSEPAAEPQAVEGDDLTQIDGIGPTFAKHLGEAGITTYAQLAALSPEEAREIAHVTVQSDPADWIVEAQSLA